MMKGKRFILMAFLAVALLLGSVPAVSAAEGTPPQAEGRGRAIRGQVTAITGRTLTVRTTGEEVRVVTEEHTVFRVPGVENASIDDISVGDKIIALGRWSGPTFHARVVAVIPAEHQRARVGGQVAAIDGRDITVNTRSGERVVVRTDGDTAFRIPGVEEPGLDDIHVGDLVGAVGTWNEDGSLQAAVVVVPRQAERRGRLVGEAAAIEGTTLTLTTRGGRQIVLTTDEGTAFHVPGVEHATLSDVQVGDRVAAEVETREGALYAWTVAVFPQQAARVAGQVSAIEGTTLVVETKHGPVQVLTDASTLFRIPGVENPSLEDVHVGDGVVCGGQWEGETTFQALAVLVPRGGQGPGRPGTIRGRATQVGSDQLTVGTAQGPVTVLVGEGTVIRVEGVENPSLADIGVGDPVGVRGQWNEDGTLQAEGIAVLRQRNRDRQSPAPGSEGRSFSPRSLSAPAAP